MAEQNRNSTLQKKQKRKPQKQQAGTRTRKKKKKPQVAEFAYDTATGRVITADFGGLNVTGLAGLINFLGLASAISLFKKIADCIPEARNTLTITHTMEAIVGQIIAGHLADTNQYPKHDALKHDPAVKMLYDFIRNFRKGERPELASKDTLNRLVNSVAKRFMRPKTILREICRRFNYLLAQMACATLTPANNRIYLDIDSTDIPLYGKQEGRYFNAFHDCRCYHLQMIHWEGFPLAVNLFSARNSGDHKSTQLIQETAGNIRALLGYEVEIVVRGDAGFGRHPTMAWSEQQVRFGIPTYYVLATAGNKRMNEKAVTEFERQFKEECERDGKISKLVEMEQQCLAMKRSVRNFCKFMHKPNIEGRPERMDHAKFEYAFDSDGRNGPEATLNIRHVLSNLPGDLAAEFVYCKEYCPRGNHENAIKEGKVHMKMRHASHNSIVSNTLSTYFKVFANALIVMVRKGVLKGTEMENATCQTIKVELIKVGALFTDSDRRLHFSLSESYPHKELFRTVYRKTQAFAAVLKEKLWTAPDIRPAKPVPETAADPVPVPVPEPPPI